MANLINKVNKLNLSRRNFLKASAAATASLSLVGCGNSLMKSATGSAASEEGEWITASCWHNCGGRCLNKALVVDGVVIRQKTDDTHPDSPDFPQQRGCARGRAQRSMIFGADRLKYPMKRKNWEPGGGKKELRGRDEWVRISWDEALDTIASEIKRITDKYGNGSILSIDGPDLQRTLNANGGYTSYWGAVSWGTWRESYVYFTGIPGSGTTSGNDRLRIRDAKLIIMWGANPAWSSSGNPLYIYQQAKKNGAKFIFIDPFYNDSAQALADEWIPIRPATDTTLLLGMAYHIIENNLQDQDFLDRYTVGFDSEHMPENTDPNNNFKDYILGTFDGIPKTPEWAAEICGVEPNKIRKLATEFATTKPALIQTAGAPARINNGEHLPHAMLTLGFMTGNIGISGSGVGPNMHNSAGNAGPALVKSGGAGVPSIPNPLHKGRPTGKGCENAINNCELWDAVLTGKYTAGPGPKKNINIQMICANGFGSALNQKAGAMKGIDAHRKVEFVFSQSHFLASHCKYSDIVLPATTDWERYGTILTGNRDILIWASQICEPIYEAKDDIWVAKEIGKRLGLDPNIIDPIPLKQKIFNQVAGATVIKTDGSGYENLVTITEKDIQELGVEGKVQQGRIPIMEFKEKGIYQVPRTIGDRLGHTELETFREDPENNPVDTPSGKLEIYCQGVADHVRDCGFNQKDPLPKYDPSIEGYEDTFSDWKNKIKGDYPLQLVTIHYLRRSHSSFDNSPWLRQSFAQHVFLNSRDANKRGITEGETVKISSRHGEVIRRVTITERVMPGVIILGEGAWIDMDEESNIDRAGNTNILNGDYATGQGHTGHNSCNVEVSKWEGVPLEVDYKWPQRIISF
ncbi:MAG: molybdopterin-dependent oxidoreductase [Bacillota bacterium]